MQLTPDAQRLGLRKRLLLRKECILLLYFQDTSRVATWTLNKQLPERSARQVGVDQVGKFVQVAVTGRWCMIWQCKAHDCGRCESATKFAESLDT